MKEKLLAIVAVIGAVISAAFFFLRSKPNAVLAENEVAKTKLKEIDKEITKSNSELVQEDILRLQLKEDIKREQNEKVDDSGVADFFNNRK